MPTYKVTDPDTGKTLRLTGDSPPTEQELEEIFSSKVATMEEPQPKLKQPYEGMLPEEFQLIKGVTPKVNPRQMAEDFSAVPAHFINQLGYNNPRGIARKAGYDYPEAEDPTLNVMSKAAGVAGGVMGGGGLLKAFGLMKKGAQATSLAQKAIQGSKAVGAGVTGGALYSPEDITDIQARGNQAMLGGVLVPLGAGAVKIAGKGVDLAKKSWNKFKSFKKIPEIEKEISTIKTRQEQLKLEKEDIGLKKSEIFGQGENISGRAQRLEKQAKSTVQKQIEHEKEVTDLLVKDMKETLDHNVEILKQDLRLKAESGELKLKDTLGEFARENSSGYKEALTNIEDSLVKTGQQLKIQETDSIINNTFRQMDETLVPSERARELLQVLKNKYGIKLVGEPNKFIRASTGQPTGGAIRSNADDSVNLSQFLNDIREVRKALSAGAKSGAQRWTHDDTAVAIFNNEWSTFLEGRTGLQQLRELNASYKPVIDAMKEANRLFSPNKGEFTGVRGGVSYLERFAQEKAKGMALKTEEEFLRSIENGSQFSEGVGGITDELVNIARQIKEAEARVMPILDSIKAASKTRVGSINQKLANRLDTLSQRKEFIAKNYLGKERAIQAELQSHMKNLGFKEDQLKLLLADKSKMYKILTTFGLGAVGLGGAGVAGNKLSQFFRGE